jgi:L-alanine-DL-glutamate epimerase-like enolase superfamily enzyme
MKLTVKAQSFPISGTFTISRGSKTSADVILVELQDGAATGRGEAVPYTRYGETVAQCIAALEAFSDDISTLPKAAQNALDCARWDLAAKQSGTPAFVTAGLAMLKPLVTAYTLSLDTPAVMAEAARHAALYPLLKLKLGRDGDEERLAKIREAVPHARLIVDANEGWNETTLSAMLKACTRYGVELVEQPLPQTQDELLLKLKRDIIICADESAHDAASLKSLRGKYDAVNIKLDKTGGLTEALRMSAAAKADGFKVMVGCMLATSLAMAPAFIVAQNADYADLDGPLLLAKDRSPAINYLNGMMKPPPPALWG